MKPVKPHWELKGKDATSLCRKMFVEGHCTYLNAATVHKTEVCSISRLGVLSSYNVEFKARL
jgi:hypothetical protein